MFFDRNKIETHGFPSPRVNHFICTSIGFQSGLLGIGGGALMIPYLSYIGIEIRKIPAISALATLVVSIIGTMAFMVAGLNEPNTPKYAIGYVYWPAVIWISLVSAVFAPIGARWTYRLPVKKLKLSFIVFLFIVAIDMLL